MNENLKGKQEEVEDGIIEEQNKVEEGIEERKDHQYDQDELIY